MHISLTYTLFMTNSHIEHYSNVVHEVKNTISHDLTTIDFFLLLCTQPLNNGVMIKFHDNELSVVNISNIDDNTINLNITQAEQVYFWTSQWLNFLQQYDSNFNTKNFDYEINYNQQQLKYNIQIKIKLADNHGQIEISQFSIILRIKSPEEFIPLPITLDSIHACYIDQKIDNLNIHNKENLQKTKL